MDRRDILTGATALMAGAMFNRPSSAIVEEKFTPETFGALGDGRTNDSAAFRRMADAVNEAGGGRIMLRRTTYVVGEQAPSLPGSPYSFAPRSILRLSRCRQPLSIEGNGATLRCSAGLRYGTFDQRTDRRVDLPMPTTQAGLLATPYDFMLVIEECRAPIFVSDLELDGNVGRHRIGGRWGDTGWQIASDGIYLRNNLSEERVRNVYTHHHARDGIILANGGMSNESLKTFENIRSDANGRQGCSLIGGRNYVFTGCTFSRSGRGPVSSAPGAGFDIESEIAAIRNVRFDRCTFSDNTGCGLVADSGDSADVSFSHCRFIGTTNWSIWPNKPEFRFQQCEVVGAAVRCFGSSNPALATQFIDCAFTDSPSRSATGKVYLNGPMVNLSDSQNVLFSGCRFDALHGAQLPWSTGAIFDGCVMRQTGKTQAFPRGVFRGTNRIQGFVDIGASRVRGRLLLNGQIVPGRP